MEPRANAKLMQNQNERVHFVRAPHLKGGRKTGNNNRAPGRFIGKSNVMVSFNQQPDTSLSHLGWEPQRGIVYTRLAC